jgi:hypothetical protein
MAGEWLKMEACTPEKSEVLAITARMGWDDADLTVGKLFRIWRWFDQQTTDGNACGVTAALLDRVVGVTGFCNAVQSVGWLTITDSGISLPNFERHNGNTAKNRALTAKRVANHKANAKGNAQGNADTVSSALPKEEKKREEIPTTHVVGESAPKPRPARKCPEAFEVTPAMQDWAVINAPLVNLDQTTATFRDHTFKTAITDWAGAWRNWMRREQQYTNDRQRPGARPVVNRQEAIEQRNQAAVNEWLANEGETNAAV